MNSLILVLGILLIIIHGLWPNVFLVDGVTVGILLILFLPDLARYLKRARILGAEFEFKEKIEEIKKNVQSSVEKAKKDEKAGKYKISPFETFKVSAVKKVLELESDPSLALAALRMEIERKLRTIADFLDIPEKERMPLFIIIEALGKKEMLYSEQMRALREIIILCNKAIHGYNVKKEEAEEIIHLVNVLNMSFPVGYSIDISPNLDYKKHGLVCEWEHCIESMPLTEKHTEKSCLLFGHNCPGGIQKIKKCGKTIKDFPKKRFVKS
jgi:hypothetical protein